MDSSPHSLRDVYDTTSTVAGSLSEAYRLELGDDLAAKLVLIQKKVPLWGYGPQDDKWRFVTNEARLKHQYSHFKFNGQGCKAVPIPGAAAKVEYHDTGLKL